MEKEEPNDVGSQTERANNNHKAWARDFYLRVLKDGSQAQGWRIPGVLKKRSNASINIEKQRAKRKTPLTRAARISARCQPYV
jgi:hypothetical protein